MTPDYWPEAVDHLAANDPVLAALVARYPAEALVCREDPFGTLARSIVGQQISVAATSSAWRRLVEAVPEVTPLALANASDAVLRECGLSRPKLRYLKDLASHFVGGAVAPDRWRALDDRAVIDDLTRIKGIGRWTAEMFLIFNLMRPDVLPLDDIGLQRAMARHYGAGTRPDRAAMERIAAPWRPWRSVATWYLWRGLDPLPVVY